MAAIVGAPTSARSSTGGVDALDIDTSHKLERRKTRKTVDATVAGRASKKSWALVKGGAGVSELEALVVGDWPSGIVCMHLLRRPDPPAASVAARPPVAMKLWKNSTLRSEWRTRSWSPAGLPAPQVRASH